MAFGVVLFSSMRMQGSMSSARQPGCLRFSSLHPVPPWDITPHAGAVQLGPALPPQAGSREEAKSPWLQERGSQKGKLKERGTSPVPSLCRECHEMDECLACLAPGPPAG